MRCVTNLPSQAALRRPASESPAQNSCAQVLQLTAELESLGGGDVALGRAWVAAVQPAGAAPPAAAAPAAFDSWCSLSPVLNTELAAWLQQGFSATVLLLGTSGNAAVGVVSHVGAAAALTRGACVGLSWQLLTAGAVRDPLGSRQQPPGGASKRQPMARPSSRLGREAGGGGAADGEAGDAQPPCTVLASSPAEVEQLLEAAQQQLRAAAAATGEGKQPPALLLQVSLQPGGGRPAAVLHVLQLCSDGSSGGAQEQQLLRLLQEVADLHYRRREGEPCRHACSCQ